MDDEELLRGIDRLKGVMIAVATGGPRIGEVQYEFTELYDAVDSELRQRSIANPIPYRDLWEWYGRWSSGEMPSWQSRRAFVSELFRGLVEDIRSSHMPASPNRRAEKRGTPFSTKHWDVFVSHASEDKDDLARPLAEHLMRLGLEVWFDEAELTLGDSLRQSIDRGLAHSRFGVVIISPSFLRKQWPQIELDGLVARESGGSKVVLPVWHNTTADEIRKYSPILAGRLAVLSSSGIEKIATEIIRVVRPAQG